MKFGAKYEVSKTLAREEIEIFSVRKKTSGEELVAYIFACPEPPQNQPTAQWIVLNFMKMAPDAPGNVLEVGHYDVANFAYIVTSLPPSDVLDAWVSRYQNQGQSPPENDACRPEVAAATGEQPTGTNAFVAHVQGEPGSPPSSALPGDTESSQSAGFHDESRGETFVTGFGAQPREPGEFTRQFFREVAAQPDAARGDGSVNSAGGGKSTPQLDLRPASPAGKEGPRAPDTSPNIAVAFQQASGPSNTPTTTDSAESQPGRILTGEFSRFFHLPSESREASTNKDDGLPPGARAEAGEFTRIFGSEVSRSAAPSFQELTEHTSALSKGSSTEILNDIPIPARENGPTSDLGGFTDLFGRDSGIHKSEQDVGYSFEPKNNQHEIEGSSSTQVFGGQDPLSNPTRVGETLTSTATSSSSSSIAGFQNFEVSSGSATVVFRPTSEPPVEGDNHSDGGPSPYTQFMTREALAGAMQTAEEASTPNASSTSAGGGAAAAPASAFNTPPAVPGFQPPSPQMPAFPGMPPTPGGAMPSMPAMAPPVIAAPKAQVPPPSPKSPWPLIIILNALFIVAVLLIIYFAIKH